MTIEKKQSVFEPTPAQKKFFEDQYASVTFVESIPCIKVKVSGVPHSSEHFQFVHGKLVECIHAEVENYCRLHMLTDNSKAGLVLEEDIEYYKLNVIPAMEKAGIRFHAIVLPESQFVRFVANQNDLSTRKIKVEYFNTVSGASKWLRHR